VIVDFAHNEAGTEAILAVAEALGAGAAGRAAPVTAIIGTAGDRPDDTLRGIGRIAAGRAQRVAIKETRAYLRGRPAPDVVRLLAEGLAEGGMDAASVPVYETELAALESELAGPDTPRVVVLFCHEQRDEVFDLLARLGAQPLDGLDALREWAPRLVDHRRR
jgi:cyanophycin synthetase